MMHGLYVLFLLEVVVYLEEIFCQDNGTMTHTASRADDNQTGTTIIPHPNYTISADEEQSVVPMTALIIAGVAVVVIMVILLVAVLVFNRYRKKRKRQIPPIERTVSYRSIPDDMEEEVPPCPSSQGGATSLAAILGADGDEGTQQQQSQPGEPAVSVHKPEHNP